MKKIAALILCAAMIFGCTAFAEEAAEKVPMGTVRVHDSFNIMCKLPDECEMTVVENDDFHISATVTSPDATKPKMLINIGFNEAYTREDGTAMKLNDVDEETMTAIKDSFIAEEEIQDVTFEETETAYGTKVLIVRGKAAKGDDLVVFYSIYNSYEVETVVIPGDEDKDGLSDEETATIIDFLSEMDFVGL